MMVLKMLFNKLQPYRRPWSSTGHLFMLKTKKFLDLYSRRNSQLFEFAGPEPPGEDDF